MRKPKGEIIGYHWKLSSSPTLSKETRLEEFYLVFVCLIYVFMLYLINDVGLLHLVESFHVSGKFPETAWRR